MLFSKNEEAKGRKTFKFYELLNSEGSGGSVLCQVSLVLFIHSRNITQNNKSSFFHISRSVDKFKIKLLDPIMAKLIGQ